MTTFALPPDFAVITRAVRQSRHFSDAISLADTRQLHDDVKNITVAFISRKQAGLSPRNAELCHRLHDSRSVFWEIQSPVTIGVHEHLLL